MDILFTARYCILNNKKKVHLRIHKDGIEDVSLTSFEYIKVFIN